MTTTYFTNSRGLIIATLAAGLTLSALAAVPAPAAAAAPLTAVAWQANVEKQIERNLEMPDKAFTKHDHAIAHVRIHFDADGQQTGQVTLAKSSGEKAADVEALRTARAVRYPVLPTDLRGRERTIVMQVYFADGNSLAHEHEANDLKLAAHRSAEQMSVQTAALETK